MAKKIVYLTSDDDSDDDKGKRPSFISGHVRQDLNGMNNRLANNQVTKQIKADYKNVTVAKNKKEPEHNQPIIRETKLSPTLDVISLSDDDTSPSYRHSKRSARNQKGSPTKIIQIDDDDIQVQPSTIQAPLQKESIIIEDDIVELDSEESFIQNLDEELNVKMKRMDRIEYFSILRSQPLSDILDCVGEKFGIPAPNIILYLNDNLVDIKSTPNSLNLTVADIFDVLARNVSSNTQLDNNDSNANDPNFITLHLRGNTKKRITLRVNRLKTIGDLAEHYAKEKGVKVSNLVLEFDSDRMDFNKKIDFYEMDDDDQIDVIVKS